MKRSRALTLVLMAPAPLLVAGCDNTPDDQMRKGFYTDVAACTADGNAADVCQRAHDGAEKANVANAPKFKTKEECIAEFGELCRERSNESGFWSPLMTGFLISQMLSPGRPSYFDASPVYRLRSGQYAQFDDRRDGYGSSGGYSGSYGSSGSSTARSYRSVDITPNRAVTVSRSGFGSVAAARSGWGGTSTSARGGSSGG
ncbi:MAG: DUF1190 domain-containing protein [Rudaea sp.]|uniref:DUF1190 domain-containing protein n=1 Tax=unclassified Rudaea TaxID=2627037 RepID=UPI0010F5A4F8|nr:MULTISPECIES: DUF1190 domain-containing protein [unclassified Rudaea]MBN8885593.1 DUF1190 domain-containing protein [Rudaea sp.]MBR0344072.1 DUF1190 domain-containing protein [Rudaea sp.]